MENLTVADLAQLIGMLQLQLLDAQAKITLLEKELESKTESKIEADELAPVKG